MKALLITFLLLFLVSYNCLSTEDPLYVNYTIKDGLPSNEIYKIIKDRKGYIWIASDGGITRFDGKNFITFNEKNGLTDAVVFELFEDHNGRIWFATMNQKIGYIQELKIKMIPLSFRKTENRLQFFRSIYVDKNETIWIGTTHDSEIIYSKKPYKKIGFIKNKGANTILDLDRSIVSCFYFYQINKVNESWKIMSKSKTKNVIKTTGSFEFKQNEGSIKVICKLSKNNFIIGSNRDLYQIKNGKVKHLSHFDNIIISISIVRNRVYVGVYGFGVYVLKPNNYSIEEHFFNNYSISSVIPYSKNGIIVSTLNQGCLLIPDLKNKLLLKGSKSNSKIVNYLVTEESKNSFYIDSKFNFWHNDKLISNKSGVELLFFDKKNNFLYFNGRNASKLDLTSFKETFIVQPKKVVTFSIKNYLKHKNSIYYMYMNHILRDSNNYLVPFCSHITKIISFDSDKAKNGIWYSTSDSVFFKKNNSNAIYYPVFDSIKSRVNSIKVRENGDLLIATKADGLYLLKKLKIIKKFSKENGLLSNTCEKIVTDENQNQWIITNLGLNYIRHNHNQIETPYFINRFFNQKIYSLSFYKNTMYLCSDKGVFKFDDYQSLMNYNTNLTTTISNFKLFSNNSNTKLSFDLECCSFENFRNFTFEYRLIRNNKPLKWIKSKSSNIVLADLNHGNYVLEVRTVLNGNYKTKIQTKKFSIKKRFYQTWWFFTLIIFSVFLMFYIFYKLIQSQTKKRERKKQEIQLMLSQMESKALRAQMNPHFIFNAMNSIQNFLLSDQEIEAVTFLGKFARLIRNILESTKSELITIKNEKEILETYIELEQLRCSYSFDFKFNIAESISLITSQIPSMIIQPFIENAIIHGLIPLTERKGLLQISLTQDADYFYCTIEDNGIGRKQAQINNEKNRKFHTSMGMGITFDRIEQIQKMYNKTVTIKIEDKMDSEDIALGTKVFINFPKI